MEMTKHDLKFDVVPLSLSLSLISLQTHRPSSIFHSCIPPLRSAAASRFAFIFISWPTTIHAEATLFLISAKIVVYTMSPWNELPLPPLAAAGCGLTLGGCGNSGCTCIRCMLCLLLLFLLLLPPHRLVAVMQIVVYCPARTVAADCTDCNIRQCICLYAAITFLHTPFACSDIKYTLCMHIPVNM